MAAAARHLELELLAGAEHDEPALGAADLDRGVEHQRQHVVQDPPRAEGAEPLEERGNLAQVANRRRRGAVDRRLRIGEQEHHLGPAGPSQPDPIAVHEHALGDLLTVHVGAVARVPIAKGELVAFDADLGVIARDLAAGEAQIVGLPATDLELTLRDGDDTPSEGVGNFEAGIRHGMSLA